MQAVYLEDSNQQAELYLPPHNSDLVANKKPTRASRLNENGATFPHLVEFNQFCLPDFTQLVSQMRATWPLDEMPFCSLSVNLLLTKNYLLHLRQKLVNFFLCV